MELNDTINGINDIDIHASTFNSTTLSSMDNKQCHSNTNIDFNHLDDTINSFGANKTLLNLNESEIYDDQCDGDKNNVEDGYYAEDFESDDDDELKRIDVKK